MDQNLYKLIRKSSFVSQSGSKFVQTYPNYHLFLKMDQNLCKLVQLSFVSQNGSKFMQTCANYHLFHKMDQNLCTFVQTIICFSECQSCDKDATNFE